MRLPQMREVENPPTVDEVLKQVDETGVFVVDIEHDPEKEFSKPGFELAGVGIGTGLEFAYLTDINLAHDILTKVIDTPVTSQGKDVEVVAFNGKYDFKCLKKLNLIKKYPTHFRDPMVGVNLLDDNRRPAELGLKVIVEDFYGYKMTVFKDASSGGLKTKKFYEYGVDDAYIVTGKQIGRAHV